LLLAWVLAQGEDIFALPGTTNLGRVDENFGALEVRLTQEDLLAMEAAMPAESIAGARQDAAGLRRNNR